MLKGSVELKKTSVELTDDERLMIQKALDYYGNRLADTHGYSAGEKYWDLVAKFQKG